MSIGNRRRSPHRSLSVAAVTVTWTSSPHAGAEAQSSYGITADASVSTVPILVVESRTVEIATGRSAAHDRGADLKDTLSVRAASIPGGRDDTFDIARPVARPVRVPSLNLANPMCVGPACVAAPPSFASRGISVNFLSTVKVAPVAVIEVGVLEFEIAPGYYRARKREGTDDVAFHAIPHHKVLRAQFSLNVQAAEVLVPPSPVGADGFLRLLPVRPGFILLKLF